MSSAMAIYLHLRARQPAHGAFWRGHEGRSPGSAWPGYWPFGLLARHTLSGEAHILRALAHQSQVHANAAGGAIIILEKYCLIITMCCENVMAERKSLHGLFSRRFEHLRPHTNYTFLFNALSGFLIATSYVFFRLHSPKFVAILGVEKG